MKFSDPDPLLVIGTERMDKNVRVFLADQGIGLRHVDINRLLPVFSTTVKTGKSCMAEV